MLILDDHCNEGGIEIFRSVSAIRSEGIACTIARWGEEKIPQRDRSTQPPVKRK
jgi:hypothetical protein